jgi:hypothetical protein
MFSAMPHVPEERERVLERGEGRKKSSSSLDGFWFRLS